MILAHTSGGGIDFFDVIQVVKHSLKGRTQWQKTLLEVTRYHLGLK